MEADGNRFLTQDTNVRVIEVLQWSGQVTLVFATLLTVSSGIVYLIKYWKYFLDD